jgi:Zn-dependent protease
MGRLSLNPLKHIDPVGTVIVPIILLALGGFLFGWAKPVPVNFANLRHPKRQMAIVAAAGPATNFVMALLWAALLRMTMSSGSESGLIVGLSLMAQAGVTINVALMVLNLLPLPPLDGGRVVTGLLPMRAALAFSRIEPYGLIILIALMASGLLARILYPPLVMTEGWILSLVNVHE